MQRSVDCSFTANKCGKSATKPRLLQAATPWFGRILMGQYMYFLVVPYIVFPLFLFLHFSLFILHSSIVSTQIPWFQCMFQFGSISCITVKTALPPSQCSLIDPLPPFCQQNAKQYRFVGLLSQLFFFQALCSENIPEQVKVQLLLLLQEKVGPLCCL